MVAGVVATVVQRSVRNIGVMVAVVVVIMPGLRRTIVVRDIIVVARVGA